PSRDVLPVVGVGPTGRRRRSQSAQRHRERARRQADDGTGDQSMSTEARTTDGGTTDTSETRDDASAAERLGGPLEDEQSRDRTGEAETDVGRRADTTGGEDERSSDT